MKKKYFLFIVLIFFSFNAVCQQFDIAVTDFSDGYTNKLYQLRAGTGVTANVSRILVVDAQGKLTVPEFNSVENSFADLWFVRMSPDSKTFYFSSKSYPYNLDVYTNFVPGAENSIVKPHSINDPQADISVISNHLGWKFSDFTDGKLEEYKFLGYKFKTDSIAVLTILPGEGNKVGIKTFSYTDEELINSDNEVLKFTLWIPASRFLTAKEFNTKLNFWEDEKYSSLKFSRDRNNTSLENPFTDYNLLAEEREGDYLNFKRENDNYFVRVDTSYANSVGVKFLNFAFGSTLPALNDNDDIPYQYDFKLEHFVHNDSMIIKAREVRFNLENKPVGKWKSAYPTNDSNTKSADSLYIRTQDLVTADQIRIVTIGTMPINTKISFNSNNFLLSLPELNDRTGYSLFDKNNNAINEELITVKNGEDFSFKINLADEYDQSTVKVAVSDVVLNPDNEGNYILTNVSAHEKVSVSGVKLNPTSSIINSLQDSIKILTRNGYVHIEVLEECQVRLYNLTGQLCFSQKLNSKRTSIPLDKGIYIIEINGKSNKILID